MNFSQFDSIFLAYLSCEQHLCPFYMGGWVGWRVIVQPIMILGLWIPCSHSLQKKRSCSFNNTYTCRWVSEVSPGNEAYTQLHNSALRFIYIEFEQTSVSQKSYSGRTICKCCPFQKPYHEPSPILHSLNLWLIMYKGTVFDKIVI